MLTAVALIVLSQYTVTVTVTPNPSPIYAYTYSTAPYYPVYPYPGYVSYSQAYPGYSYIPSSYTSYPVAPLYTGYSLPTYSGSFIYLPRYP